MIYFFIRLFLFTKKDRESSLSWEELRNRFGRQKETLLGAELNLN